MDDRMKRELRVAETLPGTIWVGEYIDFNGDYVAFWNEDRPRGDMAEYVKKPTVQSHTEWMDISTAPLETPVLLCDRIGRISIGESDGSDWFGLVNEQTVWADELYLKKVCPTHWMPLPSPPKENE